jgi:hypothetical protein
MNGRFSAPAYAARRPREPSDAPALVLMVRFEGVADAWISAQTSTDEARMRDWLTNPRVRAEIADALARVYEAAA